MKSKLIGHEPLKKIVMMENHNEAYLAWKKAGLKDRTLVHVDAHIDFAWMQDRDPLKILEAESLNEIGDMLKNRLLWNLNNKKPNEMLTIGNYIYPAIKDGIVKEFYWVVPDPLWENQRERKLIRQTLKELLDSDFSKQGRILETTEGFIAARIYDRNIVVCKLSRLPEFQESIILDIDVDFLVTESVSNPKFYCNIENSKAWIWPEELISRLKQKNIKTDFTTIAYSVEGGFTPLKYKYLGDDLKYLLGNPRPDEQFKRSMLCKKDGAIDALSGKNDIAIDKFLAAKELTPDDASVHYNLALFFYKKGLYSKAADAYKKAVMLDTTYKTAYNSYGPVHENWKLWCKAENEYRKILKFDSNDSNAYGGLGNVNAAKRKWKEAILNYKKSIELNGNNHKTHYNLGYVYARIRLYDKAIIEFEKSLCIKPDNGMAYRWLGLLNSKKRRFDEAVRAYKKSLLFGVYSSTTHFKLCWIYFCQRKAHKAAEECKMWCRLFLKESFLRLKKLIKQLLQKCPGMEELC